MASKYPDQVRLIETYLRKSGLTPDQMAERALIAPDTMRKIMRGYQPASKRLMDLMAQIASESDRQTVIQAPQAQAPHNGVRKVPLIGWAQAGEAMDFEDIVEWDDTLSVEINDAKAIGVRIRGDSMYPRIEEGDIVVLACSDRPQNGDTVVARLKDEGVICKQFQVIDPLAQRYRFMSINELYAPIERTEDQIVWIYPVDQLIKRMRR